MVVYGSILSARWRERHNSASWSWKNLWRTSVVSCTMSLMRGELPKGNPYWRASSTSDRKWLSPNGCGNPRNGFWPVKEVLGAGSELFLIYSVELVCQYLRTKVFSFLCDFSYNFETIVNQLNVRSFLCVCVQFCERNITLEICGEFHLFFTLNLKKRKG